MPESPLADGTDDQQQDGLSGGCGDAGLSVSGQTGPRSSLSQLSASWSHATSRTPLFFGLQALKPHLSRMMRCAYRALFRDDGENDERLDCREI